MVAGFGDMRVMSWLGRLCADALRVRIWESLVLGDLLSFISCGRTVKSNFTAGLMDLELMSLIGWRKHSSRSVISKF